MIVKSTFCAITVCAIMIASLSAHATITAYDIRAIVQSNSVTRNHTKSYSAGGTIQDRVLYNIEEANLLFLEGEPSGSIFDFLPVPEASYGVLTENLNSLYSLTDEEGTDVGVLNNLGITDDDTDVLIKSGEYDAVGIKDDQEWVMNIVLSTDWFIDARQIPHDPHVPYTAVLSEKEFDEFGSIGGVLAIANIESFHTVPAPAAVWLFASGLIAFAGLRRKFFKSPGPKRLI